MAFIIFEARSKPIQLTKQAHIVYLLWRHLNDYNWFEVPEIGMFQAETESSYIDFEKETIYPARLNIQFIPGQSAKLNTMLSQINEEFGYNKDEVLRQLKALGQAAHKQLKSKGRFNFEPFGELILSNGKILFEQSGQNLHIDFFDAGPLTITPARSSYQKDTNFEYRPVIPVPKKNKEMKWLLTALAFLWIIFLALLLGPKSCGKQYPHAEKPQVDSSSILTAEDSAVLKSLLETADTSPDTLETRPGTAVNLDSLETVIHQENIDSLNQVILHKDCIIIIGSFIKKSNAKRLAEKVNRNNYQLYEGKYGNFNRVGIKFNCFERKLEEVLMELKKMYHPEAWVLKIEE